MKKKAPETSLQTLSEAGFKVESGKCLRALAESGFVKVSEADGKRKVEITPRGRTFLASMRRYGILGRSRR